MEDNLEINDTNNSYVKEELRNKLWEVKQQITKLEKERILIEYTLKALQ